MQLATPFFYLLIVTFLKLESAHSCSSSRRAAFLAWAKGPTAKLSPEETKEIQSVVSSKLYYPHAVNITVLRSLSSIAMEQTKGTTKIIVKAKQLLDYLATNPDGTICYRASDMIVNVHLDAFNQSKSDACSRACGHFFVSWYPKDGNPI